MFKLEDWINKGIWLFFFCDSFRNNTVYCSKYHKAGGENNKIHHNLIIGLGLQDEIWQSSTLVLYKLNYSYIVYISTLANACLGIQNVKKLAKDRLYEWP